MSGIPIVGYVNPDGSVTGNLDVLCPDGMARYRPSTEIDAIADASFKLIDRLEAAAVGMPTPERIALLTAACDLRSVAVRCYGMAEYLAERRK